MKKVTLPILLLFASIISLDAQKFNAQHVYPIETSHSYVNFVATYMGYAKVRGSFSNFYGTVYYNPDDLSQTSVSFQIDVESISTNNNWRDRDLKSGNWFLAEKYPHIKFISTQVEPVEGGMKVTGDLTIKETTKRISFNIAPAVGIITDIRGDYQVIFTGEHTINRKEYGVMGKNWSQVKEGIAALADEVSIEFSLLGKQINEGNFKNFLRNPKSPQGSIYAAYQSDGLKGAFQQFETLQKEMENLNSNAMNMVAYMLMKQNKHKDALALMERNQTVFPDDSNVYDSLGELHSKMGKLKKAREFYEKSLSLDPNNLNAVEVLKHLE